MDTRNPIDPAPLPSRISRYYVAWVTGSAVSSLLTGFVTVVWLALCVYC